jgi:hypothetical protein
MAAASGCSDAVSSDAASRTTSSSETPVPDSTSTTAGRPSVMVPVLSSTMVSSVWAVSRLSPPLNSTPRSAPAPVPAMTAVGVASPRAHGQAMISTVMNETSANMNAGPDPPAARPRRR